jgi:CheY-like chemotaxis protein
VTSGWVQKGGVSGLGLSMAKRYVERVGGSIGVKSSIGEGSTFFFSIPFPLVPRNSNNKAEVSPSNSDTHRNSEAPESSRKYNLSTAQKSISRRRKSMEQEVKSVQKEPDTKPAGNMQKDSGPRQRKVLLVEDTRINRIILRKVLQNLNLLCDEAENGQVAVDFHRQGKTYDLVLMDKEMPVMDGHQATRQLRMMGVKTPIIALTGNAMQSDRELFFEAGVNDFQTKVSHIFWKLNSVTLFWIFEGSVSFIRLVLEELCAGVRLVLHKDVMNLFLFSFE